MTTSKTIAKQIKKLMIESDINTHDELSDLCGVPKATIAHILSGKNSSLKSVGAVLAGFKYQLIAVPVE